VIASEAKAEERWGAGARNWGVFPPKMEGASMSLSLFVTPRPSGACHQDRQQRDTPRDSLTPRRDPHTKRRSRIPTPCPDSAGLDAPNPRFGKWVSFTLIPQTHRPLGGAV
jgi:hypothetical protein